MRHMFLLLHALALQIVSDLKLWPWVCPLVLGLRLNMVQLSYSVKNLHSVCTVGEC